ncbi:MAG: helix-turn-helix domain-containing protein [Flavobacteriaceae bacterium]|nr:helix-turn-helix domain-containing protein [Flavobacteriaceae bacterium]
MKRLTVETPKGTITRANPIDGFQIMSIKKFNEIQGIKKEVKMTPHKLFFDLIIVFTKGEGVHSIDFKSYNYKPGTVFLIKNDQFHAWDDNCNKDGYLLFLTKDFYLKMGLSLENMLFTQNTHSFLNPKLDLGAKINQYTPLIELISKQYLLEIEGNRVLKNLVHSFFSIVEMEYFNEFPNFQKEKSKAMFQRFYTMIEKETPLPSRNAHYYASHFGITFKALNAFCKSMSNYTVKAFIDMIIVTRAKRALTINNQNISEIAFDLSFEEVGNFSKFFKKKTGITPNQYRKKLLAN